MAIPSSESDGDTKERTVTWSTWEELLLASAVHRHGTSSWDSVARELQKRSPSLHLVTHQICQHKFDDLKRRFTPQNDHTSIITHHLKKLRVAELKRDVQRYDLSILSLQLKVKRLEQERDDEECLRHSFKERQHDSDLEKLSPVDVAGKQFPVETSEHYDESNLRDPKLEEEEERELDRTGESAKMAGEGSCNGSSDSVTVREAEKIEPVRESEESKENSDMQSSVKSQPENHDLSPAVKRKTVECQPLVDFLEIIRSHRTGSIFLRRLESQETTKYNSMIRQPIDLETIGIRLQQGSYADYNIKFFRDMLLLSSNALVFYGSKSTESKAAIEIRQLVSKEMAFKKSPLKLESVSQELISVHPIKNPDPERSDSLFAKQKITVQLTSCRKRSLIPAKATANSSEKKKVKATQVINSKQLDKSLVDVVGDDVDDGVTKIKARERTTPNPKSSTKNSKGGALYNTIINKNLETNLNDKKNNKVHCGADKMKRGGAAIFLNKMKKGSSSSNNGSFSETLKNTASHSNNNGRGTVNKKNDIIVRRDQRSNGKKVKEQSSPLKKNVGRPTKRTIAPPLPVLVKRSMEGEDVSSSSRQARKRLRK